MNEVEENTNTINESAAVQASEPSVQPASDSRKKFNAFALLAILFTIAAWIILSFEGDVALGVGVVAFVAGCIGLRASSQAWRNTAITSIVASSVLIVVLVAFKIVFYIGLKAI